MTEAELLALYRLAESDRVERKETPTPDRIRQAICALANDLPNHREPGVVFIGQRDDLTCAGLIVDDALLQTLAGYRSDGQILPFPTMTVKRVTLDGCAVAVIEVEPSDNPPVRFNGRVWVRVGPRRATATAEDERRLVEKRRFSPEALAENHRTQDDQLRALRLTQVDGTPTVTAVLILGVEPRRWIPGAYIQFLRIDGRDLTDPLLDQRELGGTVEDQLRQADDITRINIRRRATVGGELREEHADYPEEALRQLIRNAVLHRSYEGTNAPVRITWFSDRIEIQNPGGPYGQVTRQTFGQPGVADYRNPTLAEALKAMRFIERFGVGIAIARARLAANGNPPPEFTVEDAHVRATVRPRPG